MDMGVCVGCAIASIEKTHLRQGPGRVLLQCPYCRNSCGNPTHRLDCIPIMSRAHVQVTICARGTLISAARSAAFQVSAFGGLRVHRREGRRTKIGVGVWEDVYRQGGMLAHLHAPDRHLRKSRAQFFRLCAAWHYVGTEMTEVT